MNAWVLGAAALLAAAIGVIHSWLGEQKILRPLLAPGQRTGILKQSEFVRRTVRFAWHLTSICWLGSAAILWVLANAQPDTTAIRVLAILGGVYLITAGVTLFSSRGRHLAWPLLLLIAVGACGSAVAASGDTAIMATTAALGYAAGVMLLILAVVHAYWACGGHRLKGAAIPEREGKALFVPSVVSTAAVALALLAAAALVFLRLGVIATPVPPAVPVVGCWLLAAIFILRSIGEFRFVGFFKRVTGSKFARWDSA